MFMSLVTDERHDWGQVVAAGVWRDLGQSAVDSPAGHALVGRGPGLNFLITPEPISGETVLGCRSFTPNTGQWALRLDEVAFPIGAVAYRHTHSGSGWRYLVSGSLRIQTAEHSQIMTAGDCWFEPAHTPVRAVSLHSAGVTRFVRGMAIPAADIGRSTFQLCTQNDAKLPRLQITHRHFDCLVQVDAG